MRKYIEAISVLAQWENCWDFMWPILCGCGSWWQCDCFEHRHCVTMERLFIPLKLCTSWACCLFKSFSNAITKVAETIYPSKWFIPIQALWWWRENGKKIVHRSLQRPDSFCLCNSRINVWLHDDNKLVVVIGKINLCKKLIHKRAQIPFNALVFFLFSVIFFLTLIRSTIAERKVNSICNSIPK